MHRQLLWVPVVQEQLYQVPNQGQERVVEVRVARHIGATFSRGLSHDPCIFWTGLYVYAQPGRLNIGISVGGTLHSRLCKVVFGASV